MISAVSFIDATSSKTPRKMIRFGNKLILFGKKYEEAYPRGTMFRSV